MLPSVWEQSGLRDLYPLPLNAHRHFWISRAFEREMLELIEPYLGHLHAGREPWGRRFSLACPAEEAGRFRDFAEQLASEIGVTQIRYPLG